MTQVTKAMGEIPRALSQVYYSIDGHEKGGEGRTKCGRGGGVDEKGGKGRKLGVA